MKTSTNWVIYSALRILFFAVPFALFMLIGWVVWLAAIVAALISLALSMIFLTKRRDAASTSIYEWRQRTRTEDDILEDEAIDAGLEKPASADSAVSPETDTPGTTTP